MWKTSQKSVQTALLHLCVSGRINESFGVWMQRPVRYQGDDGTWSHCRATSLLCDFSHPRPSTPLKCELRCALSTTSWEGLWTPTPRTCCSVALRRLTCVSSATTGPASTLPGGSRSTPRSTASGVRQGELQLRNDLDVIMCCNSEALIYKPFPSVASQVPWP